MKKYVVNQKIKTKFKCYDIFPCLNAMKIKKKSEQRQFKWTIETSIDPIKVTTKRISECEVLPFNERTDNTK